MADKEEPKQLYGRMKGTKGVNPEFSAKNLVRDSVVGRDYAGDQRHLNDPALNRMLTRRAIGRTLATVATPAYVAAGSILAAKEGFDRMERDINPIRQAAANVVSRSVVRGKEKQSEAQARNLARSNGRR